MPNQLQRNGRLVFGAVVILLTGWILQSFLVALAWAGVIALATWPWYARFCDALPQRMRALWAPLLFALAIGAMFLAPLGYGLYKIGREVQHVAHILSTAQSTGLAAPDWLASMPLIGDSASAWWNDVLGTPGGVAHWIHQFEPGQIAAWARSFGAQALHRFALLGFTLLAVFFLYLDGGRLGRQLIDVCRMGLGANGELHAARLVGAVRATVNGLVLVGIAEGVLIGIGYALAGLGSPWLLGAATGFLAMIPFAGPVPVAAAVLVLLAKGSTVAAVLLGAWGALILFIADHFARPVLIGGSIKLPFLWVLLGILGGMETFGLLGLFLGPVALAMAIALWREWVEYARSAPTADDL